MRKYFYPTLLLLFTATDSLLYSMPTVSEEASPSQAPQLQAQGMPSATAPEASSTTMPVATTTPSVKQTAPSTMPLSATPTIPPQPSLPPSNQPLPTVQTPAVATHASTPEIYKKQLEDIDKQLAKMNTSKSNLKSLLSTFDTRIEQCKTLALQSRKKSMEILGQTTPDAAQAMRKEIMDNLDTIKKMEQSAQYEIITPFKQAISDLQINMQLTQTAITQLEAQGVVFKKIGAASLPNKKLADTKKDELTFLRAPQKAINQKESNKSFIHYIFNKAADVIAGALKTVMRIFKAIKEVIFGSGAQKTNFSSAPPPSMPTPPQQSTNNMPTNHAAGLSPAALTTTKMPSADFKVDLDTSEKVVIGLQEQRYALGNQAYAIVLEIDALHLTLGSNQKIADELDNLDTTLIYTFYPPTWKKKIQDAFSDMLDGIIFSYNTAYFYIIKLYRHHMLPLVNRISSDVNDQIKQNQSSH